MRFRGTCASLAAAVLMMAGASTANAATAGELGHEGRWLTDDQGRVVTLHGFNMVNKVAPFHATALGFNDDDGNFLYQNGFNSVRLGVAWEAVEPQPGQYDRQYLDQIASEVEMLASYNIHTLLDFHQDQYAKIYQGNGFPEWAALDDGQPRTPKLGFPLNYYRMPALQRAFDNFWANAPGPGGVGIQDRYAAAWQQVAQRVRDLPGLIGYDLMNEPWPGSRTDCSSWAGCADFEQGPFAAFHQRMVTAIRQVDQKHLIWHEPLLPFDYGAKTYAADTGDENAGFSFHMYCFGLPGFAGGPDEARPCEQVNTDIFEQANAVSERTGDALMLTEFGADIGIPASIIDSTELADQYMVSWQEWQYDNPYSKTSSQEIVHDSMLPPTGDNVDAEKLALLSRPYPQAVAGTPKSWSFKRETREFELSYKTRGVAGKLPLNLRSYVYAPRVQYPAGYTATVRGGRIVSQPNAPVIRIVAKRKHRKPAKRVLLKVRPSQP